MKVDLTHIALHVEDLDKCVTFYLDYCNMVIVHVRDKVTWLAEFGKENEFVIVLIGGGNKVVPVNKDYSHIGFEVETYDELLQIVKQSKKDNCYLMGPSVQNNHAGTIIMVSDPNGNSVEFSIDQKVRS